MLLICCGPWGPPIRKYQVGSARPLTMAGHHDRHAHAQRAGKDNYRSERSRKYAAAVSPAKNRLSFNISFGSPASLVQRSVPPISGTVVSSEYGGQGPAAVGHLSHQLGDIVTCPLQLEPCVRIKDLDKVAPGAAPVIIAVRAPYLNRFGSRGCIEQLTYVEVRLPPCPVQRIKVSPCKTKIRLHYRRYEVDIVSRGGVVEIDYES